jgi:hypothetical protein
MLITTHAMNPGPQPGIAIRITQRTEKPGPCMIMMVPMSNPVTGTINKTMGHNDALDHTTVTRHPRRSPIPSL